MKLTIIGASGHGKVVAEIARLNGYNEIVFLDDNPSVHSCGSYPVVGTSDELPEDYCFVAIGNGKIREILSKNRKLVTLKHPNAIISDDVKIGTGTVVMAGAVINPGTTIGKGCIINTAASVDHDCIVGDYSHIAVGAHLCGTVSIGRQTWIGAGTTISNNISICGNCVVGVGAAVVKDIDVSGTYIGVPAKRLKKEEV